jgi:HlyD family secretion protein
LVLDTLSFVLILDTYFLFLKRFIIQNNMNTPNAIALFVVGLMCACTGKNGKSDAYGNFEAVEVLVSSEAQGKLLSFSLEEGETLKAGDLIGVVDTVQLSLKREQLVAQRKASASKIENILAQIRVQEEQKKILQVEKYRIENLLKDKAVPEKQLDDVDGRLAVTESTIASIRTQNSGVLAELQSIDKQIEQVADQIKRCKIINPINGTVLNKFVEPAEIVVPGKQLYKIADITQLILRVYISGEQLASVKIGQNANIIIDGTNNQSLTGQVTWISPQAEFTPKIIQIKEERVNLVYAVKILVKNDGRIKIGMPAEVMFTGAATGK